MREWKKYKLSEIATLSNGINFDKSAYTSGVKLIGVADFKDKIYPDYESLQEVDSKVVRRGDYLEKGDIVFVRSNGNKELVGRCMMIDREIPVTYSGFCIKLHLIDKALFEPVYFNYLFRTRQFRKAMIGTAVGANIQNLSQARLGNCEVNVPEIETQNSIATILSRYDTLIENYQKQIKLLEEAAQRLYKEWFVELRFPGHENTKMVDGLPEGWERKKIDDVCVSISSGSTPSRNNKNYWENGTIKWVKTKELQDGWILDTEEYITQDGYNNSSTKMFPKNTVLMAIYASPTLGRLGVLATECCCNQAALGLIADEAKISWQWLFWKLYELRDDFNSIARGAGQQNISGIVVKNKMIVVPEKPIIDAFTSAVSKMFEKQKNISYQIRLLTEVRDRLLPRLMGGEMKVDAPKGQRAINPVHRSGRPEGAKK